MRKKLNLIILTLAVFGLLAGALTAFSSVSARSNAAVSDTAVVFDFQDHGGVAIMNPKNRGTSDLVRTVDGVSMNIDTTDLPVGAYTVWYVFFNNPAGCSDGECGENDVLPPNVNPEAEVSLAWATGGIVGPDRMGHFSGSIGLGADGAPGAVLWGDGLTDPMGAEIHLIVRYHGPATFDDPAVLGAELTSVGGSCSGDDVEGGFPCYDTQASLHLP
ncbi:MAG: hypothetical protein IIB32_10000 [Chloroflexi bacterium]|nr:hypothetical protein [Chloroflexota bacterium]